MDEDTIKRINYYRTLINMCNAKINELAKDHKNLLEAETLLAAATTFANNVDTCVDTLNSSLESIHDSYSTYTLSGLTKCTDFSEITSHTGVIGGQARLHSSGYATCGSSIDEKMAELSKEIVKWQGYIDQYQLIIKAMGG